MAGRQRGSIRLWQTELFVVVIVVAILILSGSLSAGLKRTLAGMGEQSELRSASALAQRLEPEFPATVESLDRMRSVVAEYRSIYGNGIWVYDKSGTLLVSAHDNSPSPAELETARIAGLADNPPYAHMDLKPGGWVIASKAIHNADGTRAGVVVSASSVAGSLEILQAVRGRMWTTFWISLVIAGFLGFAFSELIGRRVRAMSVAAAAIASGDFDQRLSAGFVPGEFQDLIESYNRMAVKLGEAFSAVQEREREIAAVVRSMAEGVVAVDSEGIVRIINPEALRLLAAHDRDPVGRPASELTDEESVLSTIGDALDGRDGAGTVTLDQLTVLMHCTPLLDEDGGVNGAVLLLADITEQYRIEEAQRRFVADASHEMRTPIAAVKGILELLEDGAKDDPAVRDDFLHTMQVEIDRLGRLVSDLLTLARLEAGTLRLHTGNQSMAELLGDVAGVMHTLADRDGVTLAVDLPDGDLDVHADRDRIMQVVVCFTDNALKHSPADTTVRLRARRDGDFARIEVSDEGSGIDAEQISHVFDRFYRADAARSGKGGAGLGLAIAKEIVEAHGSTIDVTSRAGAGTTFAFSLPLADSTAEEVPDE
jgi:signal transduction histidine kinase